jgi:predicted metalloprotease with PDZ domain
MSDMGAQQLENGWATFVRDPEIVSAEGKRLSITPSNQNGWKISATKGQKVVLSYRVVLEHEKYSWPGGIDGVAYKRDHGVFYSGRSLFVMNGKESGQIRVNFVLPEGWEVSTPWDRSSDRSNSFLVSNQTELAESMIFAGIHERIVLREGNFEILFALGGTQQIAKKEEYRNLASGVFAYYIDLMGGIPRPNPEHPFHRVLVVLNPSSQTDGEVIGNSISILESVENGPQSRLLSSLLFAHELFHLWNGKSFFPSDDRAEWFKEGVTNYYTLKALYSTGVVPEDTFFRTLSDFFFQRYINDPGLGSIPLTRGDMKHQHWGLIYSGGMFAGIAQDMIIRSASGNSRSLDDLMRRLYREYGGSAKSYTLEDLQDHLSDLSGMDPSGFFNEFISGTSALPVAEQLGLSGLDTEVQENRLSISRSADETELETAIIQGMLGVH